MALKTGRGAAAPPFLVMDVIAVANARAAELAPSVPGVILTALGLEPLILETTAATRFQPTVPRLQDLAPPPAGLIVASPSNPAGTMLRPDELAAIAR